jgi:hypothetical protein
VRIEVLYVPGCRNYEPAVERLRKVLASQSVRDKVVTLPVGTPAEAKALRFPGSPTIRINGDDIEPSQASAPGLACRLYADQSGIPSEAALRAAVSAAKRASDSSSGN